jgi:parallel beta-helix repeat protein
MNIEHRTLNIEHRTNAPARPGSLRRSMFRVQCSMFALLAFWLLSISPCTALEYRWSTGSYRIYITGPGSATLSDVRTAVPKAPLEQVSPGVWHLRANLVVENGARLALYGTKIGGDCNELRLQSNNNGTNNAYVYLSADWGTLDIRSTKIISWDAEANGPDMEYGALRRAYVRIRSKLDSNTLAALESRMDIIDSDVGYLGSHDAEAYGLVWKVLEDKYYRPYGHTTNLFKIVNVYGNILRSRLHHNYFGMYSYGSYGQQMIDNEVDHNIGYGFDPHDDSDYLVIERNNVHHNGTHGIIASQRCNNIIIRNNISWNNGHNGIMLHRYCDDSLIEGNRSFNNGDAGIALFDNNRTHVRNNTCQRNLLAGIRLSVGPTDNLIENNEFSDGDQYGIYLYKGIDAPAQGDNGHPKRNRFERNAIHHNIGPGIFSTTADDNTFINNVFDANGTTLWFINGQRNRLESNSIPPTAVIRMQGTPSVLTTTLVRNQPALNIQVDNYSTVTFDDITGKIFDPEEPGLATTVTPVGTTLMLTTVEIAKTSFVRTRNMQVTPNAGIALVTPTIWNTTGDMSKRWLTQAGSSTTTIIYKIGDLTPGVRYAALKGGFGNSYIADATGTITFTDNNVSTGVTEFMVLQDL